MTEGADDRDRWIPRTPLERLIQIDTLLADIVPAFSEARERIVDTLPGHSGRPAGTGEPGGGRGASSSTVVERLVEADDGEISVWERSAGYLAQLDELAAKVVDRLVYLFPLVTGPFDNGTPRRLAWARWVVRRVIELGEARARRIPSRQLRQLRDDVEQLHRIVAIWREPRAGGARSPQLAADATHQLCRSCLRVGARNERDYRYPEQGEVGGLCRWCGAFLAEQGFLPTLQIVDAHESGAHGSTIAKLIRDERKAREPASQRKKSRRRKGRKS